MIRLQVLGVCRFSLLVEGGYKRSPEDLAQRAAFLFEERRLALRFAWFRHVTLPSLAAQTEKDFRFTVLSSTALPAHRQEELRAMIAPVPCVEVEFVDPGPHHKVANGAIRRHIDPDADVIAQFRVDDDDAVARDYIERVHSDFADGLGPLFWRQGMISTDYVRGLILDADGHQAQLFQTWMLNLNCGQTTYFRAEEPRALFDYGHHRMHASMPTVTMGDTNMYLRGRHGANDSAFHIPKVDTKPWGFDALPRRFDIVLDDLQTALRAAEAIEGKTRIGAAPRQVMNP